MSLTAEIKTNIAAANRRLNAIERNQIPFATSLALNRTAANAMVSERRNMVSDMVGPVKWTLGSLRFKKSTKRDLTASVYVDKRAIEYLKYTVASRRTKYPRRQVLMVPVGLQRLGGRGRVTQRGMKRYRETLLARKDHFEAQIRGTRGIFQRMPQGKVRLVVLYVDQTQYQRAWDFYANVQRQARREFGGQFRLALAYALKTAR